VVAEEIRALRGEPAADHEHLAGDEARLVAGQKQRGVRDVLRLVWLGPRLLLPGEPIERILPVSGGQRGPDHAGRDRVDPDAMRG